MTDNTFEYLLIQHCSPTLAGIKTANLFSCSNSEITGNPDFLAQWNRMLNHKDIYIIILYNYSKSSLLFVYRRSKLTCDLSKRNIRSFLKLRGYNLNNNLDDDLKHLINRLEIRNKHSNDEFPHEIGLFLNYPLWDVIGFIENKGRNYKLLGHWKVYSNVKARRKLFTEYTKCKSSFIEKYKSGVSVLNFFSI